MKLKYLGGFLVILVILGGGFYYAKSNYWGLIHTIDTGMDEATRTYIYEQIASVQQQIATKEQAGEERDLDLYLSLSSLALQAGDLDLARRAIEVQIRANAIHPVGQNTYAQILEAMGQIKKAEKSYKTAIEYAPTVEEFTRDYINYLEKHYPERKDEVRLALEQAVEKSGQNAWNMTELARWYQTAGNCELMNAHYKNAIVYSPANEELKTEAKDAKATCGSTEEKE